MKKNKEMESRKTGRSKLCKGIQKRKYKENGT
jgi:hypothetical protein